MRRAVALLSGLSVAAAPLASVAAPDPTPDPAAEVVFLRVNCDVAGSPKENCFETVGSLFDLAGGWVWNTRTPGPGDPLLVDIGPGSFTDAPFECSSAGYVSLRGSGRETTRINPSSTSAATIDDCAELEFSDLTVEVTPASASGVVSAVLWTGAGSSTWINVDLVADVSAAGSGSPYTWWEATNLCSAETKSLHYFFSTRIRGIDGGYTATFLAGCSESWLYGGEILTRSQVPGLAHFGVALAGEGDLRAFGSPIRVVSTAGSFAVGVLAADDAVFHMHGGNLAVNGVTNAVALQLSGQAFAHTPGAAMRPSVTDATGRARRLYVTGGSPQVESPFLWPHGTTPPLAKPGDPTSRFTTSITGADVFVETDCDATGCSGGSDPHLMLYSSSCTGAGGPWFDAVLGACR